MSQNSMLQSQNGPLMLIFLSSIKQLDNCKIIHIQSIMNVRLKHHILSALMLVNNSLIYHTYERMLCKKILNLKENSVTLKHPKSIPKCQHQFSNVLGGYFFDIHAIKITASSMSNVEISMSKYSYKFSMLF